MTCISCGASSFRDEGVYIVCQECGHIDETTHLVEESVFLASTFMRYERSSEKTPAYKNFEELYHSCAHTINAPQSITDEGGHMLHRMWEHIKHKCTGTKKLYLFALLYLLFRQHQSPVTLTQFLKRAGVHEEWGDSNLPLSGVMKFVMHEFNLTMSKSMNLEEIARNHISELVKLVFKESTAQMERDTIRNAERLFTVINQKEWGDKSSKNYIALVSIVSTLLSAQEVLSNMTHRKTKVGRNASFRIMTINYQDMADHMCVNVMAVKRCLKIVQQKLFALVKKLPWRAAVIKRSYDVAIVLSDILNYIDIDLQNEEFEEAPTIEKKLKSKLIDVTSLYISKHFDAMNDYRPLIDRKQFMGILAEKSMIDAQVLKGVVLTDNGFTMEGVTVKFEYVELLKDLLISGCSRAELLSEDYIQLVAKYIDMRDVNDEDNLEDFSKEEMALYFKDPSALSNGNDPSPFYNADDKGLLDNADEYQNTSNLASLI